MPSCKNTVKQGGTQNLVCDVVSKTDEAGILTAQPELRINLAGVVAAAAGKEGVGGSHVAGRWHIFVVGVDRRDLKYQAEELHE